MWKHFLKWLGMTIIVIGMIIALVYGTIEGVELVTSLTQSNAEWLEHLRGISFAGLDLAVLFVALKDSKEYFEEKKTEETW